MHIQIFKLKEIQVIKMARISLCCFKGLTLAHESYLIIGVSPYLNL